MIKDKKRNEILDLAKISPVLVVDAEVNDFNQALNLSATISSKDLGIINSKTGMVMPDWLQKVMLKKNITILITDLEKINLEEQEKFYELLKYKTISSVVLPEECKIIVLVNDMSKISATILNLCQIVK